MRFLSTDIFVLPLLSDVEMETLWDPNTEKYLFDPFGPKYLKQAFGYIIHLCLHYVANLDFSLPLPHFS